MGLHLRSCHEASPQYVFQNSMYRVPGAERNRKDGAAKAEPVLFVRRAASTGAAVNPSSQSKPLSSGASWLLPGLPAPTGGIPGPWEGLLTEALAAQDLLSAAILLVSLE